MSPPSSLTCLSFWNPDYFGYTPGLLSGCLEAAASASQLGSLPRNTWLGDLSQGEVFLTASSVLSAERALRTQLHPAPDAAPEGLDDFALLVLVEALSPRRGAPSHAQAGSPTYEAAANALFRAVVERDEGGSAIVHYGDLFGFRGLDLSGQRDPRAIPTLKRALRYDLRDNDALNAQTVMNDLAAAHLYLDQYQEGFALYEVLLRRSSERALQWVFNSIAMVACSCNLVEPGLLALNEALARCEREGDPEGLQDQFLSLRSDLLEARQQDVEVQVESSRWQPLREGIARCAVDPFDSAQATPAERSEFVHQLVPDLSETPIKALPDAPEDPDWSGLDWGALKLEQVRAPGKIKTPRRSLKRRGKKKRKRR